ncbi:hypothetical protein [Candidatus Poriferisodalis sp.]|uniref:hypothetical protein n=1 Tax=Candidatus Poriferisodalis sp. TaxID=3101277 RepID=UPI003AF556ED
MIPQPGIASGVACRYFAGLLVGALQGVNKQTLLSPGYCPVERLWEQAPLADRLYDQAALA